MRLLLICILATAPFLLKAQEKSRLIDSGLPIDSASGLVTYQEIVTIDASKTKLFNACMKWYMTQISKLKPGFEDKEDGRFSGKVRFIGSKSYSGGLPYSAQLHFTARDNKYRYVLTDIYVESHRTTLEDLVGTRLIGRKQFLEAVKADFKTLTDQLKTAIQNEIKDEF